MTGYLGKVSSAESDIIGNYAQAERDTMWGPIPGEILTYDAVSMTATVRPLYKPVVNGQTLDMPDLYEVPVDMPRTANGGMTFPVPVGSKVMLTPQMRAMDDYEDGADGHAYDARSFHVSNMRASLSGGDSLSDPLPNVDPDNVHFRFNKEGTFGIRGSQDGKFKIEGSEGNLYDIIATFMELVAADQLQINYGSSAGTGHQLQNRDALVALAAKVRAMAL